MNGRSAGGQAGGFAHGGADADECLPLHGPDRAPVGVAVEIDVDGKALAGIELIKHLRGDDDGGVVFRMRSRWPQLTRSVDAWAWFVVALGSNICLVRIALPKGSRILKSIP